VNEGGFLTRSRIEIPAFRKPRPDLQTENHADLAFLSQNARFATAAHDLLPGDL
jgi:hypothetical protein